MSQSVKSIKKEADKKSANVKLAKAVMVPRHIVREHSRQLVAIKKIIMSRSSLIADYVDVKSDSKQKEETATLLKQFSMMRDVARSALGYQNAKAKLYVKTSLTGGAGAALANSSGLVPSGSAEWASYISLYDEVRVNRMLVHWFAMQSGVSMTPTTTGSVISIGYDPTYNTTPSSVVDVAESQYHQIRRIDLGVITSTQAHSGPAPTSGEGLWNFPIRIPKQPVANAATVTGGTGIIANFPGEWMAAGDASDSVGYLRVYGEAPGGTNIWNAIFFVEFDCEFRIRT